VVQSTRKLLLYRRIKDFVESGVDGPLPAHDRPKGSTTMKLALTVWDGRISPVFDVSREALILTIQNGAITERRPESIDAPSPASKINRLTELGVDKLICGGISEQLYAELTAGGVQVIAFVAGEVEQVAMSFLAGALPDAALSMPGCFSGLRRRRRRRGSARGRVCGPGSG
jgi:predicted Fe-Mo cluster-binding NifX family protein